MSIRTTLKHPNKYCNGCPLSKACNKNYTYIPTEVHYSRTDENDRPQVDVLIVGEAPGKNEDNQGMPFAGPSGNEIKRALKQAGLSESYAITHSVRCRPVASDSFDKNRPPTKEEIAACSNYLRQDIEQLKPKVIVMLGNTGKEAVAPKEWKSVPIQKLQGEILNIDGITYTATLNPDIFLKKDSYIDKQRFYRHISNVSRILSGEQSEDSRKGTTLLLKTEQDVNDLMDSLENEPTEFIFVDTETENLNRVAPNKVATIQFARDNDIGYVIPLEHWQSPFKGEVLERIKRRIAVVFSNPDAPFECWGAHNSKFDYNKICKYFNIVRTAKPMVDTIMLEYLRDENQRRGGDDDGGKMEGGGVAFDLKSMVKDKLGFFHYNNEILDVRKSGSLIDEPLENPDGSISGFTEYAGMDVYVGRRLLCYILKDLDKSGHRKQSWRFANKWGSRVTHLLSKIELNGAFADKDQLAYLQSDTSPILTRMEEIPEDILSTPEGKAANKLIVQSNSKTKGLKPLFNKVPTVFDIDKKDHRIALLVDTCKLEPLEYGTLKDENGKEVRKFLKKGEIDKGNGIAAINKKFYQHYAGNYFSDLIQEYEGMKKLKSSYLNSVQSFLYDEIIYTKTGPKSNADNLFDGRIHASFHESKTVTGRLASSDPNLQQLPSSSNFSKAMIKSMYGASPGNFILEADYGQAEVRWWAQIAKDKEFAQLFWNMYEITQEYERNPTPELKLRVKNECDIHRQVSSSMNRIPISDVTSDLRQAAKGLVFGTIFGMAASSLARVVNCTEQEAQKLMYDLTNRFERAGGWLEYIEDFAIDNGYVISPYGRVRHLAHLIGTQESTLRRLARNSPIQGSASDTTALAAWCLQDWIERNNKPYLIWNAVHDAVYLEAPLELEVLKECLYQVKRCMSTDIGGFIKEEFGIDLIVPLVVEFKIGLRGGHCKTIDATTNLKELISDLKAYDNRLHNGEKWWQIVTKNEITKLEKEISALEKDKPEGFENKIEKLLKVKNKHLAQITKT